MSNWIDRWISPTTPSTDETLARCQRELDACRQRQASQGRQWQRICEALQSDLAACQKEKERLQWRLGYLEKEVERLQALVAEQQEVIARQQARLAEFLAER